MLVCSARSALVRASSVLFIGLTLIIFAPAADAATYRVGPTRSYKSLRSVASLLRPGDTVLVDGNATYGAVNFTRDGSSSARITIRGVRINGKRPRVSGGSNTVELAGDYYTFEGFEVTGGSSRCIYHHAHSIVISDSVVHHCPAHGVLGGDYDTGSLTMRYVEVHHCGSGTQKHQVYVATDETKHPGAVFRMEHCYVHDATGGHNVKSRAERNEIHYNWIEGALYHELELIGPDGGDGGNPRLKREDSQVVGNVLLQKNNFYVIRVGGDGTGETNGRYRFVNNTILAQSTAWRAVFRVFDGIDSLEMHRNVLYSLGGGGINVKRTVEANWVSGKEVISGSDNWVPKGSTNIPSGWTNTITGTKPGFVASSKFDFHLTATSPLIDKGVHTMQSPAGHLFPGPLLNTPAYLPPQHRVFRAPLVRKIGSGRVDVGAFERAGTTTPSPDTGVVIPPDAGVSPSPDSRVVRRDSRVVRRDSRPPRRRDSGATRPPDPDSGRPARVDAGAGSSPDAGVLARRDGAPGTPASGDGAVVGSKTLTPQDPEARSLSGGCSAAGPVGSAATTGLLVMVLLWWARRGV